jgi:hypothetical protein
MSLEEADPAEVRLGYAHAGLIGSLRPDVAYPHRKIKAGSRVVTVITSKPCDCDDENGHIAIYARRIDGEP